MGAEIRRKEAQVAYTHPSPLNMNSFAARLPAFRAAALRQPVLRAPIVRSTQSTILQQTKLFRARTFTTTPVTRRSKEDGGEQSAHTISQRLRTLKRMPPELIPLFIVIFFALGAAAFALGRKLMTDKTLRLTKSKKAVQHS